MRRYPGVLNSLRRHLIHWREQVYFLSDMTHSTSLQYPAKHSYGRAPKDIVRTCACLAGYYQFLILKSFMLQAFIRPEIG